jgi:hypothetical protein
MNSFGHEMLSGSIDGLIRQMPDQWTAAIPGLIAIYLIYA